MSDSTIHVWQCQDCGCLSAEDVDTAIVLRAHAEASVQYQGTIAELRERLAALERVAEAAKAFRRHMRATQGLLPDAEWRRYRMALDDALQALGDDD